jgi:hypothetical protein
VKLVEFEPGRFRIDKPRHRPVRSDLPLPHIISDIMPPTEQVDGKFYESKRAFRKVGRELGLTEVGTEKLKPKTYTDDKHGRRNAIKTAVEKYKAGQR